MSKGATSGRKGRLAAGIAGAALLVAVPSAGFAVSLLDGDTPLASSESFAGFTPATADPRVARLVAERGGGKARFMRFTPAGTADRGGRAVTVAVRIDEESAQAISVRSAIGAAQGAPLAGESGTRIAPTRYNLGLARGYRSFAQSEESAGKPSQLSSSLSGADIPDLSDFEPTKRARQEESRFAARVQLDEDEVAGAAPSSIKPERDQTLDVAGSYRLTRNLDVTAGVRYSKERERLVPLPDIDEQDSQAVYIGTQFRF